MNEDIIQETTYNIGKLIYATAQEIAEIQKRPEEILNHSDFDLDDLKKRYYKLTQLRADLETICTGAQI